MTIGSRTAWTPGMRLSDAARALRTQFAPVVPVTHPTRASSTARVPGDLQRPGWQGTLLRVRVRTRARTRVHGVPSSSLVGPAKLYQVLEY
jgi:hypothetical protein